MEAPATSVQASYHPLSVPTWLVAKYKTHPFKQRDPLASSLDALLWVLLLA